MAKRKASIESGGKAKKHAKEPKEVRVLISDKLAQAGVDSLRAQENFVVDVKTGLKKEQLLEIIGNYDAIVVRSGTQVTAEVFAAAAKGRGLKIVGRAGTGVDNIDLKAATAHGCIVSNAPGGNALAAAEHTVALIFSLARNVPQANQDLRAGRWERKKHMGFELAGKKLGIAGLGRIGREVARRALACGMQLLGYDPYLPADAFEQNSVKKCETLDELFRQSDFITLHMPLTDETRFMVSKDSIAKMKKGVRIVNCARGPLIDEAALVEALESGQVGGAAVDVFEEEPPAAEASLKLVAHPKVVATPHLGASTVEAQNRCGVEIAEKVGEFFVSGVLRDTVNFPMIPPNMQKKMQPVVALAEQLGRFVSQLADGSPVSLSVECFGEIGMHHRKALVIAAVKGVISTHLDAGVCQMVNALSIAEQRGLQVDDSHSTVKTAYAGLLRLKLVTESETFSIGGTVFGHESPRIVELETVPIDLTLDVDNVMLVNRNKDVPGVIGSFCTVIGKHGINVVGLQLGVGVSTKSKYAVSIVTLDREPSKDALAEMQHVDEVLRCRVIRLN